MTAETIEARVLPAVMRLLDRQDLKGGVMVKLAKEAGMSLSTLYAIVPSKSDLMFVVAGYFQRTAMERVAARLSGSESEREVVLANALEALDLFTADPEMGLQLLAPEPTVISPRSWDADPPPEDEWLLLRGPGAGRLADLPGDDDGVRSQLLTYAWLGVVLHRCQGLLTRHQAIDTVRRLVNTVYGQQEDTSG